MSNNTTTPESVEKVARAIDAASKNARLGQDWRWFIPEAQAAIAALADHQSAPVEKVTCVACEGHPALENNPCAVCGASREAAATHLKRAVEAEEKLAVAREALKRITATYNAWNAGIIAGQTLAQIGSADD